MKKLVLLMLGFVCLFTSCDVEDDGPQTISYYAEVTEADLPEYFEKGKTYEIEITYLLPSACHTKAGIVAQRGGDTDEKYREIYIVGLANADADLVDCNIEEDDLEETGKFTINIDREEDYTFFLWQGVDEDEENIYTEVVVPVGVPDEDTDEETEE